MGDDNMRCQNCGDETTPASSDCRSCGSPLDRPALSPGVATYPVRGIGLAAVTGLGLTMLLYVVLALFPGIGAVLARQATTAEDADVLLRVAVFESMLSVPHLVAYLAAAMLVMVWMFRARKNTDAFPGGSSHLSAHWAITGWWVPFASLVVPCKVMADIARDSLGRVRLRALVGLWWAAWLVFSVGDLFSSLAAVEGDRQLPYPQTPQDFQRYSEHYQATAVRNLLPVVACLVAGVSLILLILRISAAQQARIERGTPARPGATAWPGAAGAPLPAGSAVPAGLPVPAGSAVPATPVSAGAAAPQPVTAPSPQVPAGDTMASLPDADGSGGTITA